LDTYRVIFDGGSMGNPGHGYGSYAIFGPEGYETRERLDFEALGNAVTNNQAEYLSLIAALARLSHELGHRAQEINVEIGGDSQLVVSQITGHWKVRSAELRPLHAAAIELIGHFGSARLTWHPRAQSVEVLGH
jgi:ribonuclease HI